MKRKSIVHGAATVLVAIAAIRIIGTHRVFSHTFDEAYHLAAGIEWLQHGRYTIDRSHPPLARVAAAVGPYVDGTRIQQRPELNATVHTTLYDRPGQYRRTLALARLGIVPFFLLAAWATYAWASRILNETAGLVALGLFTLTPAVLAHAGLVTTDMALAGILAATLYVFVIWLERPTTLHSVLLGVTGGCALLAKMSALLFLPISGAAVVTAYVLSVRSRRANTNGLLATKWTISQGAKYAAISLLVSALAVWAGYRFSFHWAKQWGGGGLPIIAGDYVHGVLELANRNRTGQFSYLFGELGHGGRWYFFPIVIAVKTPIPLLILTAAGAFAAVGSARRSGDWRPLAPFAAALAIVGASMPADINGGVRHILPIFPLLSITAAIGVLALWRSTRARSLPRVALVGLLAWLGIGTMRAHPDYLAYFNESVRSEPDEVLVDSDLDWGQDLLRLSDTLRARGIDSVAIAYYGTADLHQHGIRAVNLLEPNERATGWVAASVSCLRGLACLPAMKPFGHTWLNNHVPIARIGKSIRLFHIPGDHSRAPSEARLSQSREQSQ